MSNPKAVIRLHRIVAALAIGFAVYQTFELAATREDYREAITTHRAAIYGVTYALTSEQAKAGNFEAQRNEFREALDKAGSYVGELRYRVGKLEEQLKQCNATNSMISDEGWTGNAYIRPEGE